MANSCETCKHYEVEVYNEPCVSCRFRDYDLPTNWESPFKQKTNADCIRAMSDELLASQMVVVVEETIKALTDLDVPYEILNEVRSQLLERLKQPAEGTE